MCHWPLTKANETYKDDFIRTTLTLRESKSTYNYGKVSVIDLCQIDWFHSARHCGVFLASFLFMGTTSVHYAEGGLKGSTFPKHLDKPNNPYH